MRYTKYFVYLSLILSQSYDIMPNAKMDAMLYLKFFLSICESKKLNLRTILRTFLISVIYLKKGFVRTYIHFKDSPIQFLEIVMC